MARSDAARILLPGGVLPVLILIGAVAAAAGFGPSVRCAVREDPASIYDQPKATNRRPVKLDGYDSATLICDRYEGFMVKRVDTGTPVGEVAIAIVPTAPKAPPADCTPGKQPGEIAIQANGYAVAGAKGNFIVLTEADPLGGVPFVVHDRRSGQVRYADRVLTGLSFIADDNDTLHLRYKRGLNTDCSVPGGGQACWNATARKLRFPAALAAMPAPVSACSAVYRKLKVAFDDPSIIVYDVDLTVSPRGYSHVLSRGEISCAPMP